MFLTDLIPENTRVSSNAHHIGVYRINSDNTQEKLGNLSLNELMNNPKGGYFNFGVLSDVNLDPKDSTTEINNDAFNTMKNAIDFFKGHKAKFACVCGNMALSQHKDYEELYSIPIFASKGNLDFETSNDVWQNKTMPEINTKNISIKYQDKVDTCNFYFLFNNCYFIFLSSDSENGGHYFDENIDWLHSVLDTHRNERCFVFLHSPFYNKSGNLFPFFEDRFGKDKLLYYNNDFNSYDRLKKLNEYYKNAIWFSGQTKYRLEDQFLSKTENVFYQKDEDGTISNINVHVPGCFGCNDLVGDDNQLIEESKLSQGYLISVYDRNIIIYGVMFRDEEGEIINKYVPIGTYYINTKLVNVDSNLE